MAISANDVQDIKGSTTPEDLADSIVSLWDIWKAARSEWEEEKSELRNYLFATDTRSTSNAQLPWKNSTTLPKLTQIRDNLHANYMSALFPHTDWFKWSPEDREAANIEKAKNIEGYMKTKLTASGFYETMSRAVYDYIDYGNAFGEVSYIGTVHNAQENPTVVYQGPKFHRVSPMDLVFDITSPSFQQAPKITRSLISLGTLKKESESPSGFPWAKTALDLCTALRANLAKYPSTDVNKHSGLSIDGFGDFNTYLTGGLVEILEFEGDIYDPMTGSMLIGHRIVIVDRKHVVENKPFESWYGTSSKDHVAWRLRPDNLLGMGPLDNLVGMQYRIDHLENLKADVFDQIAHPVVYERGYVEDWEWGPGERIKGDQESAVQVLAPDTTALNADFQIQNIMQTMEEMAGAPRQAMGIRTPGEKTAFEVQSLDNASSRIFQSKISWFEENFVQPTLNKMLEAARRNINVSDVAAVVDDDYGTVQFISITEKDLKAKGKLVPMGARHFARKNQLAQNLIGMLNSAAYADEEVKVHISSLGIAQTLEELLDIQKFGLVKPSVRIQERLEMQQKQTSAEEMQIGQLQGAAQAADIEAEEAVPVDE